MAIDPDDFEIAMDLAKWIELELRLPTGFVCALLSETDWGFVIKLNGIFESLLNVSITRSLLSAHTTPGWRKLSRDWTWLIIAVVRSLLQLSLS